MSNPNKLVIPVPYKGMKYEIHINRVMRPMVGYHVSIYRSGKQVASNPNVLGTQEDGKKEGSKMIVADYHTKSSADAHESANLATANETSPYANGTIKLTWVDRNDYKTLHSQMFDNIEEALKNTYEKRNWLIFKLSQSSGDNYNWELLPYGNSKSYTRGMFISDRPLVKFLIFGLALTGAYFIGKAIHDKLKEGSMPPLGSSNMPTPAPIVPSSNVPKVV